MKPLLETTDPKYLRRLAKEVRFVIASCRSVLCKDALTGKNYRLYSVRYSGGNALNCETACSGRIYCSQFFNEATGEEIVASRW